MSRPPSLSEFGLIGMDEAERLDQQRFWSLPECILKRIPTIKLHDQFKNTSACEFVQDGYFSFQALEKYVIHEDQNGVINGIGDPTITDLCQAAINAVSGDYRAFACKKFVGMLYKYSGSEFSSLGYLPALGPLPLFHINSLQKNDVVAVIEDVRYPLDILTQAASELDEMAGLIAALISRHGGLFLPEAGTRLMTSVMYRSWVKSLHSFAMIYPNCAVSTGTGIRKLREALPAHVQAIDRIMAEKRKQKHKWIEPDGLFPVQSDRQPVPQQRDERRQYAR